ESRERFEAAATRWERAGDARAAATCRALHEQKRGSMLKAAEDWEALGEPKRAAECAVEESGLPDMRKALIGDREIWLAQGREMAAARARDEAREARKQKRSTRLSRAETVPHPDDRASTGSEAGEAADPTELAAAILDAVTRSPGLTCERIAEVVRSPTALVKPHLAA